MGMIPLKMEFPFAELLLCMGFLFILLIESIVHKMFGGSGGHGHGHGELPKDVEDVFDQVIILELFLNIIRHTIIYCVLRYMELLFNIVRNIIVNSVFGFE